MNLICFVFILFGRSLKKAIDICSQNGLWLCYEWHTNYTLSAPPLLACGPVQLFLNRIFLFANREKKLFLKIPVCVWMWHKADKIDVHAFIKAPQPSNLWSLCRFWVLRGQRQRQHQREADLWAPGRHHLRKDVREPGRWRSCRHRGQTGAPADRAACPSSPGLCMLKMTTTPNNIPPSPSSSPFSWTPGPRVRPSSPSSLTFLLLLATWQRSLTEEHKNQAEKGLRFFYYSGCVCLWILII